MTNRSQPNIVFVIIDALRADRIAAGGYEANLSPTIDRMASSGAAYMNCHSVGCPTQMAFPGIWTSTMPFDYGGYTDGIHGRPAMLAEELQRNGYQTMGITTGHPASSHFGYDRGFEDFLDLIDMHQWFRANYVTLLGEKIEAWKSGKIADAEISSFVLEKFERVLDRTLQYIDALDDIKAPQRRIRRSKLRRLTLREREVLRRDPMLVVEKFAELKGMYDLALGEPVMTPAMRRRENLYEKYRAFVNRRFFLTSRRKIYDGDIVNDQAATLLQGRDPDKPYFLYAHYFDLHEYKLLVPNLSVKSAAALPADFLAVKNARGLGGGGFLYDLALWRVDRALAGLEKVVAQHGDPDNTIFVLTGDHGVFTGAPFRENGQAVHHLFFDNFTRVPLIFKGKGIRPEMRNGLVSHLDLAPSVLGLAGIEKPAEMQGSDLTSETPSYRDYVMMESAGSGRCDFDKTLYLSIRMKHLRCTYEVEDFAVRERDAFDLLADPDEQVNLVGSEAPGEDRAAAQKLAEARIASVKADVFGSTSPEL